MTEAGEFASMLALGAGLLGATLGPIGQAWGRRIEARIGGGGPPSEELAQRVADLEACAQRVAELEERVDFAERMLSQQREADQLPAGGKGA
jgi:hypothetical protein